jgi:hypothetical protein
MNNRLIDSKDVSGTVNVRPIRGRAKPSSAVSAAPNLSGGPT